MARHKGAQLENFEADHLNEADACERFHESSMACYGNYYN